MLLTIEDIQNLLVAEGIQTREICDGVVLPYYDQTGYPVTVAAPGKKVPGGQYNEPFTPVGVHVLADLLSDKEK